MFLPRKQPHSCSSCPLPSRLRRQSRAGLRAVHPARPGLTPDPRVCCHPSLWPLFHAACQWPAAPVTKYHRLGGFKQIYSCTFLQAQSQNQGVTGPVPSEVSVGGSFLPLPLPASGGRQRPWCPLARGCSTPVSVSIFTCVLPSVSVSLSDKDASHRRWGPLTHSDL